MAASNSVCDELIDAYELLALDAFVSEGRVLEQEPAFVRAVMVHDLAAVHAACLRLGPDALRGCLTSSCDSTALRARAAKLLRHGSPDSWTVDSWVQGDGWTIAVPAALHEVWQGTNGTVALDAAGLEYWSVRVFPGLPEDGAIHRTRSPYGPWWNVRCTAPEAYQTLAQDSCDTLSLAGAGVLTHWVVPELGVQLLGPNSAPRIGVQTAEWPEYGLTVTLTDTAPPSSADSMDGRVAHRDVPDSPLSARCVGAWRGTEAVTAAACDGLRALTPREKARAERRQDRLQRTMAR